MKQMSLIRISHFPSLMCTCQNNNNNAFNAVYDVILFKIFKIHVNIDIMYTIKCTALNYNHKIYTIIIIFFLYMSTQEENKKFELVTFASLGMIPVD
jgi:hypothetical protein